MLDCRGHSHSGVDQQALNLVTERDGHQVELQWANSIGVNQCLDPIAGKLSPFVCHRVLRVYDA